MIQINELRIGNYVNVCDYVGKMILPIGLYRKVSGIMINGVDLTTPFEENEFILPYQMVGSILLTEEILLKCGFEKYVKANETFFKVTDTFELHQFNEKGDFSYKCGDNLEGNFVNIRVDYLHQLQNLYFVLIGKELNVNL